MNNLIQRVIFDRKKSFVQENFRAGDLVEVSVRVKEGEKERSQIFKGTVIKVQGSGMGRAFTVRKMSSGVGVERTFPFSSPSVESVKVLAKGTVRRSRLYYLRGLRGKKARIKSELVSGAKAITTEIDAPSK